MWRRGGETQKGATSFERRSAELVVMARAGLLARATLQLCKFRHYLVAAFGAGLPGSPRPANKATLVSVEFFASRFLRLRPAFCLRFLRFTFEALVFEAMTTILASEGWFSSRLPKAMSRFGLAGPRDACEYRDPVGVARRFTLQFSRKLLNLSRHYESGYETLFQMR